MLATQTSVVAKPTLGLGYSLILGMKLAVSNVDQKAVITLSLTAIIVLPVTNGWKGCVRMLRARFALLAQNTQNILIKVLSELPMY
jgi:hypothetical protein